MFCISRGLGQSFVNQKLCKGLLWLGQGPEASSTH